jgi:hypothetical protein
VKSRAIHLALGLIVGLAVTILGVPTGASPAVAGSVNCSDFGSQAAAQRWYINHGGPQSDPAGLDTDHDGVACESNPCPCSSDQGGGGGGTPGHTGGGGSDVGQIHAGPGRGLWSYKDKAADAQSAVNVKKTSLDIRKKGYYRVRVYGGDFAKDRTDLVRIYFDTRRTRSTPEFAVTWYAGDNPAAKTGTVYFEKTTSWRDGKSAKCKGIQHSADYRRNVMTVSVPRKCLSKPSSVRWSGFTGRITRAKKNSIYGVFDDFPHVRAFPAKWVA